MSLYELNKQIEACIKIADDKFVNTEDGEVLDLEAMEALELAREVKIENVAMYIKSKRALAEGIKAEIESLTKRMKSCKNEVERCTEYLANNFEREKYETAKVKLSWRKSESVNVPDVTLLPEEYRRVKEVVEADKNAIKDALKAGEAIAGAELVVKKNLQIN